MDNSQRKLVILGIMLGVAMISVAPVWYYLSMNSACECESYLESAGFLIVRGEISAPFLILDVEFLAFLLIADVTDATVYRDGFAFYVFDSSMLTAYRYEAKIGYRYDFVRMGDHD